MSAPFVHLHLHSEYALVDSTIRIDPLIARCAQLRQPAVAITDRNNLFAAVKFYRAAEQAGIKPVIGCDLQLAERDEPASSLTVLCRDHGGYLALSRLLTRAWMEGHRNDGVVVRPEWLDDATGGLFALAGRTSAAARLLHAHRDAQALAQLRDWQARFGEGLHLELTRCGHPDEAAWNAFALHAAGTLGLPIVASNDVRFLDADGFAAHEARVCIASGRILNDVRRPRDYTPEQWLKPTPDMASLFADLPDAIDNAVALAMRCNLELTLGEYSLPAYPVPSDATLEGWMRAQAHAGLDARLRVDPLADGHTLDDYRTRLERELDVIIGMGFAGYFMIVADFINWAKDHGIPVGPGRGSGAGSLVAWALGITDLDPIPYGLLFERFLNPERVSMPDFDIDFCMDRRDEVIDYVAGKYGRDRVSQIITYGTMAAKAVIRDTGRVLDLPYGFVDGIAKLVPMTLGVGLEDALGRTEKSQKDDAWRSDELIARYAAEEEVRDLIDLALELEDLTRNAGKHAGGVVIAPSPLSDFCPLFAEHDEGGRGRHPVTQFDKDDVEAVGLVKFDFLGLRTLTIIDWAVKAINARRAADAPALDIARIPLDDAATYALFARADTVAVFQFESRGMRDLLKRALPDRFDDLIALVSLYRPGPMDLIPTFVERKHGREEVRHPHALLEPILAPTYGVVVYQEQVMQTAQILGGYSLGGADLLRRAMGKKKPEEMAKERSKFESGARTLHGMPASQSGPIFDLLEKFAGYGFNKSHAAAYALVSYQTAWLKTHHPAEFMAAVLSSDMDNTDKVTGFLAEARHLDLQVLPPDVNASAYLFEAVDAGTLRYGLGAIKGVGRGACEAIVAGRLEGGPYRDLLDFCSRVGTARLNRRVIEALVLSGALDGLDRNRATLMLQLPEVLKATEQQLRERESGQNSLFGGIDAPLPQARLELPTCADWPLMQRLQGERDTLGHYLSGHPIDAMREDLRQLVGHDLSDLDGLWQQRPDSARSGWRPELPVVAAGLVVGIRRSGEKQAFVMIDDGRGQIECAFFGETAAEFGALLTRDRVLVVQGGLREDRYSGGLSINALQAWDFERLCDEQARQLTIRIALHEPSAREALDALLARHRPGHCPVRLQLRTASGIGGQLLLPPERAVRASPTLLEALRALPGVQAARISLTRPWS